MTKAKTTHKKVADRLVKAAEDLKELGHPSLAMRASALAGEVNLAKQKQRAVAVFIDEPR